MLSRSLAVITLALLAFPAIAQEENRVIGMIVDRTPGGFWAKFDRPVAEGSTVRIRVFQDSADVSTAQVSWASNVPPYEAYLTRLNPGRRPPGVTYRTPYQDLFREKSHLSAVDRGDRITPGYYVSAVSGTPAKVNDVLRGLMDLIDSRPDFRDHLKRAGREHIDWPDVHMILDEPLRVWTDPITARIAFNMRELLTERNNVQGPVPGYWFPADEARKKSTDTGANK